MKKQIFILVIAVFASVATAFGQAVNNPAILPVPLTCTTNDPLNPIAGRPYDYTAILNPAGGSTYWYATKSTTFTTGGARVAVEIPADGTAIATGATNYRTALNPATTPSTTQVTWTSAGLAGVTNLVPLFMVVEYTGPTCSNNMKVMQIIPKIAFTVDITNMVHGATPTTLAYGVAESQCFDVVQSSMWDGTNIVIDYGKNILYYEVIAANFTGSYLPTFQLTGLTGTQTADIDWGTAVGTYGNVAIAGASGATVTTPAQTVTTAATNTSTGVSIYVRVTVYNHGFEGLANEPIALAVEAVDGNTPGNPDVMPNCVVSPTPFEDTTTQNLNARPAVTPGTPQVPQLP